MYSSNLPESHVVTAFVVSIVFSVVGVVLNALTLVTLATSTKLRQHSTTAFVISLTISDLLFCAISLPLNADNFSTCAICHTDILCKLFAYFFYGNLTAMMMNQAVVAFNRYITVCFPISPPFNFTLRISIILIALTWLFPFIILLAPLTELWGSLGHDPRTGTCTFLEKDSNGAPRKIMYIVGLGIPTIIVVFCYLRIFIFVKTSSKRIRKRSQDQKEAAKLNQTSTQELTNSQVTQTVADLTTNEGPKKCVQLTGKDEVFEISSNNNAAAATTNDDLRRKFSEAVSISVRERELRRERQEIRMTITLFSIFIAFVVCTLPPVIILVVDPGGVEYPEWHIPLYIFGWAFGVINPVIYICFNKTYRAAYKATLLQMLSKLSKD